MSEIFPAIIKAQYDPSDGFAAMRRDAADTSSLIRRQFESDFADVGRIAREALSIPRNAAGSLDLDPKKYRDAADNAKALAIAQREIATAARSAASSTNDTTEATRRYIQACDAAALAAEREAKDLALQASTYERLQTEIDRTRSSTQKLVELQGRGTTANGQLVNSQRSLRQATVQTGQQLQDIAISLQGGQRASTVFAQQLPQLAFALSGVGGRVGAVATALSGPLGLALVGGSILLGTLIDKLFGADDASDKLKKSTLSLVDALQKQTYSTEEGLKALREYNAEKDKARDTDSLATEEALRSAKANLTDALALRERLAARLALSNNILNDPTSLANREVVNTAAEATRTALAEQQAIVNTLRETINNLGIDQAGKAAEAAVDPVKRINEQYDRMADAAKRAANENHALTATLQVTLTQIEKQRKAALDAEKEQKKLLNTAGDLTGFISPVSGPVTSGFGARKQPTKGASTFHPAIDFAVPIGTGIRAPAVGTVEAIGFDRGLGKYVVINHGAGTKSRFGHLSDNSLVREGQLVQQGDIIGRTGNTGISTGPHLDYQITRNGKAVDPRKGPFPIDAVKSAEVAERALQKQSDELERTLERVQSRYGKTADAIQDYRDALVDIATLEKAGSVSAEDASSLRLNAALRAYDRDQADFEKRMSETFGRLGESWQRALTQPLEPGGDFQVRMDEIMRKAAETLGTQLSREGERGLDFIARHFGGGTARFLNSLSQGEGGDSITRALNAFGDSIDKANRALIKALNSLFDGVFGKNGQALAQSLGAVFASIQLGEGASSLAKSLGLKQSKLGSQIGGAIGGAVGGPVGALVGGLIGGTIGGFFKKTPKGSTTLTSLSGDLSYSGSGKLQDSVLSFGDSVRGTLSNIIEALNGTAGSFAVSVGQRGKNFTVDPTGRGRTKGAGVLKFASEEEAARAALLDAINDGAVQGLRQGAQNLLRAGKDIEGQLAKAVKFQSAFDRLKAIKDPVGAALDTLNREFTNLKQIFQEAGASAEEFAQLEELYGIERKKAIEDTTETLTASLKSLIEDLTTGDNGLSLRDRLKNARALFDPLAADINSGKSVDYERFSEVAHTLLDIQRQFSGSQGDYFATFNEILSLSQKALQGQENVISLAGQAGSPFATTPTPSNDNTPVVNAIDSQTAALLAQFGALNGNVISLIRLVQEGRTGGIGLAATGTGGTYF